MGQHPDSDRFMQAGLVDLPTRPSSVSRPVRSMWAVSWPYSTRAEQIPKTRDVHTPKAVKPSLIVVFVEIVVFACTHAAYCATPYTC